MRAGEVSYRAHAAGPCPDLTNDLRNPVTMPRMTNAKTTVGILAICMLGMARICRGQASDGTVTNGVYHSTYFEFRLPLPKGAVIAGRAENTNFLETGAETLAGSKPDLKKEMVSRTAVLLTASKFPLDSGEEGQWVINISAERLQGNSEGKTGEDYLRVVKDVLEASKKPYTFNFSTKPVMLCGVAFYEMTVKDESPPSPTYFRMLCALRKGYGLLIGITAEEMASIRELDGSLAKMSFK